MNCQSNGYKKFDSLDNICTSAEITRRTAFEMSHLGATIQMLIRFFAFYANQLPRVVTRRLLIINSWVSRDVIHFTGVNSKSIHCHQKKIFTVCVDRVFGSKCVQFREICLLQCSTIINTFWVDPPLRITEKGSSDTQECYTCHMRLS